MVNVPAYRQEAEANVTCRLQRPGRAVPWGAEDRRYQADFAGDHFGGTAAQLGRRSQSEEVIDDDEEYDG